MSRQLTFTFTDPVPPPVVRAKTAAERTAAVENPDDRRLAEAVIKNRWNIKNLLTYMESGLGAISMQQQNMAGRIRAVAETMIDEDQALFLGKAILRMQPRIRATRMPMPHRITVGTLRRAGKHLPYAKPKDEE